VTTNRLDRDPEHLVLVVDLEATCCDRGSIPDGEMEIIEIGACWAYMDGTVVERFECLVRPTLHPDLTPFCRDLLGLRQADVDGAGSLSTAALRFGEFVSRRRDDAIAWGSWGAFDRNQMFRECERLGLADPIQLPHQNLKQRFAKARRIGKQVGMRKALELIGLSAQGAHHRALDDALNIARLLPWLPWQPPVVNTCT
jgi:inhibitor of KinA sporulation pathway (predicted exonuclease)